MVHGDTWEGRWRGNMRMEWVASILHTTSEHGVSSITTADAHTSAASSRLNWCPRIFKWTRPFRRKTKSIFCACAITFQLASTYADDLLRFHLTHSVHKDTKMYTLSTHRKVDGASSHNRAVATCTKCPSYLDLVHPQRSFRACRKADLSAKHVDNVFVSHGRMFLQTRRSVPWRLQLLPPALRCQQKNNRETWSQCVFVTWHVLPMQSMQPFPF
jgi:hypothetical protein